MCIYIYMYVCMYICIYVYLILVAYLIFEHIRCINIYLNDRLSNFQK